MNFETLRALFERICDCLEGDAEHYHLLFKGAYGIEHSSGVVMIFCFEGLTVIWRFWSLDLEMSGCSCDDQPEPLSTDECLAMIKDVNNWEGGFSSCFDSRRTGGSPL